MVDRKGARMPEILYIEWFIDIIFRQTLRDRE